MCVLSRVDLEQRITELVIPAGPQSIQPASIDLRLGDELLIPYASFAAHVLMQSSDLSSWIARMYPPMWGYVRLTPDAPPSGELRFGKTNNIPYIAVPAWDIYRGQFVLGVTYEEVRVPTDCAATLSGKSSNARHGLSIHQTGGVVDPGFRGKLVLELYLAGAELPSFTLTPGMAIAQIQYELLRTPLPREDGYGAAYYGNHYAEQPGIRPHWNVPFVRPD